MSPPSRASNSSTHQHETESEFIHHTPCDACGSSDANAFYDDGHTFCFSCGTITNPTSFNHTPSKPQKKINGLLDPGQPTAWNSRGLTLETCKKWGISLSEMGGKPVRIFAYRDKTGRLVAQKVRGQGKTHKFLGDTKNSRLFGQHLWRDSGKKVVITEGEIDAASVSQVQNHKWPVVSIPNGAPSARKALQKSLDWLSGFEEVILMYDNDGPGQEAVTNCADLFKPGQCRVAKFELKDANEMLLAGRRSEIIDAIWGAKVWRPDGIILGKDLWTSLNNREEKISLPYPWKGLQAKSHGCRLGEVVTITAGSGLGKSAIVRELAHHLIKSGETVGMLMFEESIERTALGLMSIEMSKNLPLTSKPQETKGFKDAFETVIGNDRVYLYDHFGSTEIGNVLDRIRYLAKACEVKWMFLDHLSILVSGLSDGDERRMLDNAMTELKSLAMECNIGLFIVSHLKRPPKGKGHEEGAEPSLSHLRGSHAIAQLSDIVIGAQRNQQSKIHNNITTLRVLKNRWSGETGVAGWLKYDQETGRLNELETDPFEDGDLEEDEDEDLNY